LWNVETGESLRRIADAGAGYGAAVFTPDGRHAVRSGDTRGKWSLWDLDIGKEVRSYYLEWPFLPKQIVVSSDGRLAVCGNFRGSISIWRMGDPPAFGQELAEARRSYDEKLRDLGPDAPQTLQALDELAALHLDRDEPADAEPLLRQSLERKLRLQGAEHPATLAARKNLAGVLDRQNKLAEATVVYRQCLETYRRAQGPEHPDVLVAMDELADILEAQGKDKEADGLWQQCLQGWECLLGHEHTATRAAVRKLVLKLQSHGKLVAGEALCPSVGYFYAERGHWDKALAGLARGFARELPKDQGFCLDYACLLVQAGDRNGYRKLCVHLRDRLLQNRYNDDIETLAHTFVLAPQALPDTAPILELAQRRKAAVAPGSPHHAWTGHVLALAYYRAGQWAKAREYLKDFLTDSPGGEHDVASWLLQAMIDLRLGHAEKAGQWLRKADQWMQTEALKFDQRNDVLLQRSISWRHWLMIQLLRREAEALLPAKGRVQRAGKLMGK
jgi:tetratricopeptide (TPR) repeat protein